MKRLSALIQQFNDRLTRNPDRLPPMLFQIDLTGGPTLYLDGPTNQLISEVPDIEPDCTITATPEAIETLLETPTQATHLVLTGQITFDNAGPVMQLATALKGLVLVE